MPHRIVVAGYRSIIISLTLAFFSAAGAWANNSDLFGLGARGAAMANALTAVTDGFEASYYNPGGLGFASEGSLTLGAGFVDHSFRYKVAGLESLLFTDSQRIDFDRKNRRAARVDDFSAYTIGAVFPHRFGGEAGAVAPEEVEYECSACGRLVLASDRTCTGCGKTFRPLRTVVEEGAGDAPPGKLGMAFGLGMVVPPKIVRIFSINDQDPQFVLFEGRGEKLALYPALALVYDGVIGIGVGASVLADFDSKIVPDIRTTGSPSGLPSNTNVEAALVADGAPNVGVQWRPLSWLSFGAVYRGELALKVDVEILTFVDPVAQVNLDVEAITLFSPQQFQVGIGIEPVPDVLLLTLDATWYDWSAYAGPAARMNILPGSNIAGAISLPFFLSPRFKDVIVPRVGLELAIGAVTLRSGYAFHPTPAPRQSGQTNLLDADRHIAGGGIGLDFAQLGLWRGRLDAHVLGNLLANRAGSKVAPGINPPSYHIGGQAVSLGLEMTFLF